MSEVKEWLTKTYAAWKSVSDSHDADVIVFAADVFPKAERLLCHAVRTSHSRPNAFFILATYGGSADCAYRITRCLQKIYKNVVICVPTFCKSAGTLITMGANELVMSDWAELGPLDVQLLQRDATDRTSGLVVSQALQTLSTEVAKAFEKVFLHVRERTLLNSDAAANVAGKITSKMFQSVYDKFDPIRIGEIDRAMAIAEKYGERLSKKNIHKGSIRRLIMDYPSHEFVIDRNEAENVFRNLRSPTPDESALCDLLANGIREAIIGDEGDFWIELLEMDDPNADNLPPNNEGDDHVDPTRQDPPPGDGGATE